MNFKNYEDNGYGCCFGFGNHLALIACFHVLQEVGAESIVSDEGPLTLCNLSNVDICLTNVQLIIHCHSWGCTAAPERYLWQQLATLNIRMERIWEYDVR